MRKAFVISDIHGCYEPFMKLMEYWNKDMELVILGDVIDRGKDSLKVVQQLMMKRAQLGKWGWGGEFGWNRVKRDAATFI